MSSRLDIFVINFILGILQFNLSYKKMYDIL